MPLGLVHSHIKGFSIPAAGRVVSGSDDFDQPDGTFLDSYGLWADAPGTSDQNKLAIDAASPSSGAGQRDVNADEPGTALWQSTGSTNRIVTLQATFRDVTDITALGIWIQNDSVSSGYWAGYNTTINGSFYSIWKTEVGPTYTSLVITSRVPDFQGNNQIKFIITDKSPGVINLSLYINDVLFGSYDDASPLTVGIPAIQVFQPGGNESIPNITNFSINASGANQGNVLYWLS